MFENLGSKLTKVFDTLTGRGVLSEKDVKNAMKEIRNALIEADVALEIIKEFINNVSEKAIGAQVVKSVTPGQMVVKIVHDEIVNMLGKENEGINLIANPPVCIMMVGLQGSGKTTTTAKIANQLTLKQKKKALMASLDVRRPAAQEQLRQLGEQINVETLPVVEGQSPTQIAQRAENAAKIGGFDVVMLDTAGRTHIDEELMGEMEEIKNIAKPHEILLIADALTGQDAVKLARNFDEKINLTGIVLTRIDADARGGAALSMRAATGKPIKLIGVGEKINEIEEFYPQRIADRILGMGDVVSLVEKAAEAINQEQAKAMEIKMRKGMFDLNDFAQQIKQMNNMGGMGAIIGLMPGMKKMKNQIENTGLNDNMFKKQIAIINSMTKKERKVPKILNASRKKRVATGCGASVQEINQMLKMHRQMADMMKKMSGKKGKGMMNNIANAMGARATGTGNPAQAMGNIDFEQMQQMTNTQNTKLPGLGGIPFKEK